MNNTDVIFGDSADLHISAVSFKLTSATDSNNVVMQQLEKRDENKILTVILVIPKLLGDLSERAGQSEREREREMCSKSEKPVG